MAYYEILFGSGFYWMERYVIKTDYPTTDYGALTDCLIDYLKEKNHPNIVTDYEYLITREGDIVNVRYFDDEDGDMVTRYHDEFVIGGNCGDVLLHYGDFRINEITENEIKDAEIVEV